MVNSSTEVRANAIPQGVRAGILGGWQQMTGDDSSILLDARPLSGDFDATEQPLLFEWRCRIAQRSAGLDDLELINSLDRIDTAADAYQSSQGNPCPGAASDVLINLPSVLPEVPVLPRLLGDSPGA